MKMELTMYNTMKDEEILEIVKRSPKLMSEVDHIVKLRELSGLIATLQRENAELKRSQASIQKDVSICKIDMSNVKEDVKSAKETAIEAHKATYNLDYTGKLPILQKAVTKKIFSLTGQEHTPEYILFYGKMRALLQKKIKDTYSVTRWGLIPDKELDNCLNIVDNFYVSRRVKSDMLMSYADKYTLLGEEKKKAFDKYMEKTGGNVK